MALYEGEAETENHRVDQYLGYFGNNEADQSTSNKMFASTINI